MAVEKPKLSKKPSPQLSALRSRRSVNRVHNDNWYNANSKFGGVNDPTLVQTFGRRRNRLDRATADALYEFEPLAAKVVDKLARDATREWVTFSHEIDPAKAELLREEDNRLDGRGLFEEAVRWSRLFGGNLLTIQAFDGGDPEEPLRLEGVRETIGAFNTDRWLAFPHVWYREDDDPKFGQVELYRVMRMNFAGSHSRIVHESRTIKFDGNPLSHVGRIRNWGWGASVLDRIFDALRNWGVSNQAAASVIPSFITMTLQISNLQQLIASGQWDVIQTRIAEMASQMATQNIAVHGGDETLTKDGTPVTGLSDLMDKFMQVFAGAADYPKSILFQAESGALGGTAAGVDVQNYFSTVGSYQETYLRPRVRRWVDIIGVPLGLKPGEIDFEFNQLWKLTEGEQADVYLKTAQADTAYVQSGIIDAPERFGIHRFGGNKFNGTPPVVDTTRMEEFVKQFDEEPVELGPPPVEALPGEEGEEQPKEE